MCGVGGITGIMGGEVWGLGWGVHEGVGMGLLGVIEPEQAGMCEHEGWEINQGDPSILF